MRLKFKNQHRNSHILTFSGYILAKHRKLNLRAKKQVISLLGYGWGAGLSIIMLITFLQAYFGNDYRFAIDINSFGEAHIELIALMIVIPTVCYGFYLQYKELKKNAHAKA